MRRHRTISGMVGKDPYNLPNPLFNGTGPIQSRMSTGESRIKATSYSPAPDLLSQKISSTDKPTIIWFGKPMAGRFSWRSTSDRLRRLIPSSSRMTGRS